MAEMVKGTERDLILTCCFYGDNGPHADHRAIAGALHAAIHGYQVCRCHTGLGYYLVTCLGRRTGGNPHVDMLGGADEQVPLGALPDQTHGSYNQHVPGTCMGTRWSESRTAQAATNLIPTQCHISNTSNRWSERGGRCNHCTSRPQDQVRLSSFENVPVDQ